MPWVKLDDGYFRHPKAIAAGPLARELNFASWCWSSANLTDGRIPKHVVPLLAAEAGVKPSLTSRLVEIGLWHDRGDHYEIHDYLDRNPSRNQVEKERARWRRNKRGSTEDSTAEHGTDSNGDSAVESRRPGPARPVVLENSHSSSGSNTPPLPAAAAAAVDLMLAVRYSQDRATIRAEKPWRTSMRPKLEAEHGPKLLELCAEYTDPQPSTLAMACGFDEQDVRFAAALTEVSPP